MFHHFQVFSVEVKWCDQNINENNVRHAPFMKLTLELQGVRWRYEEACEKLEAFHEAGTWNRRGFRELWVDQKDFHHEAGRLFYVHTCTAVIYVKSDNSNMVILQPQISTVLIVGYWLIYIHLFFIGCRTIDGLIDCDDANFGRLRVHLHDTLV